MGGKSPTVRRLLGLALLVSLLVPTARVRADDEEPGVTVRLVEPGPRTVPDVRLLTPAAAARVLADAGLNVGRLYELDAIRALMQKLD